MVNENEKYSYLCETNPRVFIVLEKQRKHFSGHFFRYEIYFKRGLESDYNNEFTLFNVGEIFGYRFYDIYREICNHLYRYMHS